MKKVSAKRKRAKGVSRFRLRGKLLGVILLILAALTAVVFGAAWYRSAALAPPAVNIA